jgi:succinate dehydrogenase hydrophobic anchor subunit
MGKIVKRLIILLLVAFVLYFILKFPDQSAGAIRTFFGALKDAFWQVYNFFANLGR